MSQVVEHRIEEREVTLGDLRTRWFESGNGTQGHALLLPSIGLGADAYHALRKRLPQGWRVCGYDPRGHRSGTAEAHFGLDHLVDDALAALTRMNAQPVHLMGHSMGGVIAALAAARAPDGVASVALVATPAAGSPAFAERATTVERDGFDAVVQATLARWFDGEADTSDALSLARSQLRDTSQPGFISSWRALASFADFSQLGGRLPAVRCIAAERDLSTPPAVMQRILDDLQRAQPGLLVRMDIVLGAGHMVPLTHPDAIASLVASHWATSAST